MPSLSVTPVAFREVLDETDAEIGVSFCRRQSWWRHPQGRPTRRSGCGSYFTATGRAGLHLDLLEVAFIDSGRTIARAIGRRRSRNVHMPVGNGGCSRQGPR